MMNRRELFAAPLAALGLVGGAAAAPYVVHLDTSELVEEIAKLRRELESTRMSESLFGELKPRHVNFGDIHIRLDDAAGSPEDAARKIREALLETLKDV